MEWISCPTAPQKGTYLSWPKFGVRLQFENVQMVMNRHRLGDSHGAPLSSIATSTAWSVNKTVGNSPFPFKIDLEPRDCQRESDGPCHTATLLR